MPRRHHLPSVWLFTDPRSDVARALNRLPRGAGVIFRHYELSPCEREALGRSLRATARRKGLIFLVAGDPALARRLKADGYHRPSHGKPSARPHRRWHVTAAAHDRRALVAAARAGADLAFLSPAFPTRSHPGAPALGPLRFGLTARGARLAVAALGGMSAKRFRRLRPLGAAGWGAIDAWEA